MGSVQPIPNQSESQTHTPRTQVPRFEQFMKHALLSTTSQLGPLRPLAHTHSGPGPRQTPSCEQLLGQAERGKRGRSHICNALCVLGTRDSFHVLQYVTPASSTSGNLLGAAVSFAGRSKQGMSLMVNLLRSA